jgi:hypothetical protein
MNHKGPTKETSLLQRRANLDRDELGKSAQELLFSLLQEVLPEKDSRKKLARTRQKVEIDKASRVERNVLIIRNGAGDGGKQGKELVILYDGFMVMVLGPVLGNFWDVN